MSQSVEDINRNASNQEGARSGFLYGNMLDQKRYMFVLDRVQNLKVLDCACGIGWGSYLMAHAGAQSVVGVEISSEAVASARKYYAADNLDFINSPLATAGLPKSHFEVITSFETLEHVERPAEFLSDLRAVARQGATMFLSTPNGYAFKNDGQRPANPFHFNEYTRDEVATMCESAGWAVNEYRGQYPMKRGSAEIDAYRDFIKSYWLRQQRSKKFGLPYRLVAFAAARVGYGLSEPAFISSCDPVLIDDAHEPAYHYFTLSAI
jgi:2-polyprenyl-3-methyl-5-hydroxy-6-metoxy-1,4-benzoquinol methylase